MKSYLAKALLIAGAAALLAVSVDAQQSVRAAKKAAVLKDQVFGFGMSRSGGTTGGTGGIIIGPAPTQLSPIAVDIPLP